MLFNLKQFQEWGRIGGKLRAQRLSKARRKAIAKGAVKAREKNRYIKTGNPRGPKLGSGKVDIAETVAAYRNGKTQDEIALKYGVTRQRIQQVLIREGLGKMDGGKCHSLLANIEDVREARKTAEDKKERRMQDKWGLTYEQYKQIVDKYGPNGKAGTPLTRYMYQRRNAKYHRNIEWNISFFDWWTIWQESGHYPHYGRGQGKFVMSRYGDTGAYEVGNVLIISSVENNSDRIGKKKDFPMGVRARNSKFVAYKMVGGKQYYIGTYSTVEQASAAYQAFTGQKRKRK